MKNKIIQKEIRKLSERQYGIKHFENLDEPLNIQTTLGIKKINQHFNLFYKIINISFEFY